MYYISSGTELFCVLYRFFVLLRILLYFYRTISLRDIAADIALNFLTRITLNVLVRYLGIGVHHLRLGNYISMFLLPNTSTLHLPVLKMGNHCLKISWLAHKTSLVPTARILLG